MLKTNLQIIHKIKQVNRTYNVIHKVHQNGENYFPDHRFQNKDPTNQS